MQFYKSQPQILLWSTLLLAAASCAPSDQSTDLNQTPLVERYAYPDSNGNNHEISVLIDSGGVKHIEAPTSDHAAVYGVGYVQTIDRSFQMYFQSMRMRGRMAENFGLLENFDTIANDKKMRTLGFEQHALWAYENLDQETQELLTAFAAGVNAAMEKLKNDNNERLPESFISAGITEVKAWTPIDSLLCWMHVPSFFNVDYQEFGPFNKYLEIYNEGGEQAVNEHFFDHYEDAEAAT